MPSPPLQAAQWIVLTIIISSVLYVNCFQTNSQIIRRIPQTQSSHRIQNNIMMSSSFQQARLAEQLRLSTKQRQFAQSEDIAVSQTKEEENTMASAQDRITFSTPEEARELLELEKQDSLDDYNAPMMTYQKYLTMQVCFIFMHIVFVYFNMMCKCILTSTYTGKTSKSNNSILSRIRPTSILSNSCKSNQIYTSRCFTREKNITTQYRRW